MRTIFLDYSTTTPLAASVRESMLPFLGELYGHPSSSHWIGRAADEAIEDARSHLASLIGCHPSEFTFTSGGTESINLALLGIARAIDHSVEQPHLIISELEHAAVRCVAQQLQHQGWDLSVIPADNNGLVDIKRLASEIKEKTRLVSVMHASHQFGTVQPIEEIAELCQKHDILFHTDASQTVGKIECSVEDLGVDLLSLSGHKFYGPMGIGGLYVRTGVPIESVLFGESAEAGLRPGTQSVANVVGLGQAAKLAQAGLQSSMQQLTEMRCKFHQLLEEQLGMTLPIIGGHLRRVPGLHTIQLPIPSFALKQRLPELCFGEELTCPHSADGAGAIGLTHPQLQKLLRISIGWTTNQEELHKAANMIASAFERVHEDLF